MRVCQCLSSTVILWRLPVSSTWGSVFTDKLAKWLAKQYGTLEESSLHYRDITDIEWTIEDIDGHSSYSMNSMRNVNSMSCACWQAVFRWIWSFFGRMCTISAASRYTTGRSSQISPLHGKSYPNLSLYPSPSHKPRVVRCCALAVVNDAWPTLIETKNKKLLTLANHKLIIQIIWKKKPKKRR